MLFGLLCGARVAVFPSKGPYILRATQTQTFGLLGVVSVGWRCLRLPSTQFPQKGIFCIQAVDSSFQRRPDVVPIYPPPGNAQSVPTAPTCMTSSANHVVPTAARFAQGPFSTFVLGVAAFLAVIAGDFWVKQ